MYEYCYFSDEKSIPSKVLVFWATLCVGDEELAGRKYRVILVAPRPPESPCRLTYDPRQGE